LTNQWIVLLTTSATETTAYGPFDDQSLAVTFAGFLTEEVDPARMMELRSSASELLCFWSRLPVDRR